jgi:hypothetical protein
MEQFTENQRRSMRCGWIPAERWKRPSQPRIVSAELADASMCPGYSAQDPRVAEVALAWTWREKGQLLVRFPEPWPLLLDAIDVFQGAVAAANDWYMAELERGGRRG